MLIWQRRLKYSSSLVGHVQGERIIFFLLGHVIAVCQTCDIWQVDVYQLTNCQVAVNVEVVVELLQVAVLWVYQIGLESNNYCEWWSEDKRSNCLKHFLANTKRKYDNGRRIPSYIVNSSCANTSHSQSGTIMLNILTENWVLSIFSWSEEMSRHHTGYDLP